MIEIPVNSESPWFSQKCELEGVSYQFEFLWNNRASRWYLSLLDDHQKPVISGLPVVSGYPVFNLYQENDKRFPPGILYFHDTTGKERDPDRTSLGTEIKLLYLRRDER